MNRLLAQGIFKKVISSRFCAQTISYFKNIKKPKGLSEMKQFPKQGAHVVF